MTIDRAEEILKFWFHGIDDRRLIKKNEPPFNLWFVRSQRFDDEIRANFMDDLDLLGRGELGDWESTARGRLAMIILGDQFSRNIFRDSPQMYALDHKVLSLAQDAIAQKMDASLPLIFRVFMYMPFMHAENLDAQNRSVELFERLVELSKNICPENTGYFEYNLKYANSHRDIVRKFGRFPHRNKILERASTEEEKNFLKT